MVTTLGGGSKLYDRNGLEVGSVRHDPFREVLGTEGQGGQITRRKGEHLDPDTGLVYFRNRYYDPKLGRFLTQDSYLGEIDDPPSLHRYVYGCNRPTEFIDPTGQIARQMLDQ